jgi:dihydroflavonol-4-reductase
MYEINVRGTRSVLEAARRAGVPRAVHTSTIGTIGQPAGGALATEVVPFNLWDSASHYAKSKYLGEVVALNICRMGLSVVVVNPCAPVGPRDIKPTSTGQRIVEYLRGKKPSFVAGGINFVAVDDVAEGHVLAAERGRAGERYILGHADGNLCLPQFMDLLADVSGAPKRSTKKMDRARRTFSRAVAAMRGPVTRRRAGSGSQGHRPAALTCDPSRAIRELGLPQTPLRTAFAEAVAWFREQGYANADR